MSRCTLTICLISLLASGVAADSGMCTSKPDGLGGSPGEGSCSAPPDFQEEEHEEGAYHHPKLIDISMPLTPGLPVFQSSKGLGSFKHLAADMDKGASYYSTEVTLGVHTGTHVDAPAHYLKDEFKAGNTVDKLDLEVLIGPALVLDIPLDSNITADVLTNLNIPHDAERILFKTANSQRDLLRQTAFASDYIGLSTDGARFLVEHTHVKLTGIDYLSIARQEDLTEAHQVLLGKGIIPVEGLDLTALEGGRWYHLTCLPLNIPGAEGSPTRCVVYGPDTQHEEDRRAALEYPLEDEHEAEHGHEHDSVDAADEL